MTQFQCTAALVRTTCISHCPELLCKTGCQQACVTTNTPLYISSTYRFPCPISIALQHWSGRNAFLIAQSCSAKQADSYVVKSLCGVQCLITNALQHWSEQKAFLIARSCSAKQADSIAVSHHQCTTALVKTKCFPHCPDLLCKTG